MRSAIYPGSFDPLTNGHLDIVQRASHSFDRVLLAISNNASKNATFSIERRVELAQACVSHLDNVEVVSFNILLVDYAKQQGVKTILRGLRATSDFEYEFQLATMNRKLAPELETLLMMTSENGFYISSRLIREIARFGGDVSSMVPKVIYDALQTIHS